MTNTYLLGAALKAAKQRLRRVSESGSLDAELLLCAVLDVGRTYLIAHDDRPLNPDEHARYEAFIRRREDGEPVAYIRGYQPFYDRTFIVSPAVLIPRPETEHLLEAALTFARSTQADLTALDVGTGSGILAVTFAAHMPEASVYATDISPEALAIARQNASAQGVQVDFHQGHLATALLDTLTGSVDLLMANLPYIASDEIPGLDVSQYEPHLALDGGGDGLRLIVELLQQSRRLCHAGSLILLEIGADQGEACRELAQSLLSPAEVSVMKDLAGHNRVLQIVV